MSGSLSRSALIEAVIAASPTAVVVIHAVSVRAAAAACMTSPAWSTLNTTLSPTSTTA